MVARLSILILLGCLFGVLAPPVAARQACLGCHPLHYAERGSCVGCHRGNPASDRKNIAHQRLIGGRFARFTLGQSTEVEKGKRLLVQFGCRRCHESGGRGNRLATSLDASMESRTVPGIVASLKSPAMAMPDFRLNDDQIVVLVNALFAGSGKAKHSGGEQPLAVHFGEGQKVPQDVFSRNCAACHRLLTRKQGLLGSGNSGPNLSGLLSEFYPASYGDGKRWTPERLRNWLMNPRRIRPATTMRPVVPDEIQRVELENILAGGT